MEVLDKVKERPILFNGEMVSAILENRKTQTRRVMKPQPPVWYGELEGPGFYTPSVIDKDGEMHPAEHEEFGVWTYEGEWVAKCPYGKPGDQLWVRETWNACRFIVDEHPYGYLEDIDFIPKSKTDGLNSLIDSSKEWALVYRATDDFASDHADDRGYTYRPSIHMPRWASRIQLEIADVRVERVQDISETDARDEGVTLPARTTTMYGKIYTDAFEVLWDSINEKRTGCSWAANPFVWVVEFKQIERTS